MRPFEVFSQDNHIVLIHLLKILYQNLKKNKSQKKPKKKIIASKVPKVNQYNPEDSDKLSSPFNTRTKAKNVKFICDEMLGGLCKTLRKIGIDCVVVANFEDSSDCCIKIALQEKRFILTRGQRFIKFTQYLPFGHCYKIYADKVENQVIEVLKYYNVILTESDIFSRCQICNSNEFILLNRSEMQKLKYGKSNELECNKQTFDKPPARNFILSKPFCKLFFTKTTNQNKKIQLNQIPEHVIDFNQHFYICEGCGKCYWDGSHLEKVLNGPVKQFFESQ